MIRSPLWLLLGFAALAIAVAAFSISPPSPPPSPTPPSPPPSPTPTPTPKPLTFAQMQSLYGPCVNLPTLMYHHLQPLEEAAPKNQTGLTVAPDTFRQHLEYLRSSHS